MSDPQGLSDRLLILGDEPNSARATERLLNCAGFDAVLLDSFDEARKEMRAGTVSMAIIEISPSRMVSYSSAGDGDLGEGLRLSQWAKLAWIFCEEVRAGDSTAGMPILIIAKSH